MRSEPETTAQPEGASDSADLQATFLFHDLSDKERIKRLSTTTTKLHPLATANPCEGGCAVSLHPHRLRISDRARQVCLRMTAQHGLEVVVPRGYDVRKIQPFIESKRRWIKRTEQRLAQYRNKFPQPPIELLPKEIVLPAVAETWSIGYEETSARSIYFEENGNHQLMLRGPIKSGLACKRALRKWLLQRAQVILLPWLRRVGHEVNLPYETASVRWQKTRWGSCSPRKTISVNAKLLFLRPETVRYLFIHELAHLMHMNHSRRYWDFVGRLQPNYKTFDAELRKSMHALPRWVSS